MTEKIYPGGIRCFAPNDKAPQFILGTMIIDVETFQQWVLDNAHLLTDYKGSPQLKLTVMQSKSGGVNVQVDTWKANKQTF